ncbi:MAG: hypothetical protein PHU80_02430, partial [Kiritimatiellae bacterium]|nr:hypothetical protein [Kiritimatiellia bacterium]
MNPVRTVLDEFEDLTAMILDGAADDADRVRFNEIAQEYPEFRSIWLEQVRLHAMLVCRGGGRSGVLADAHELVFLSQPLRQAQGRSWPPEYRLNDQSAPWPTPAPLEGRGKRRLPVEATERVLPAAAVPAVSVVVGAVGAAETCGRRMSVRFRKLAAAAAVLALAGAGLWLAAGDGRRATGDERVAGEVPSIARRLSPVEILHHWGSCNLEVPRQLPGT